MWLIVRSGPDAGAAVEVAGERFVLGRQRGCDLVVRDERASRRHAELVPTDDGRLRLRDLGSANGTYLEGQKVQDAVLEGGEELRIGDVIMSVAREAPAGGGRPPAPEVPTYSMVGRLIEQGTRRARRTALAAGAVAIAAVVALGILLATGTLGGGESRVPEVVERLTPATVLVETRRAGARTGTGSGWVLDARGGLIVTNAHVVNEGAEFRAADRPARIVAVAPCEDLALLRVQDTGGLRAAPLGTGASVEQGETVVALGYGADARPGDSVSSTTGVVSVPSTSFRDPAPDVPAYPEVVQTDTALNPGNSGGPLADLDGRVIGIDSAARTSGSDGRPLQNVNYAIAIDRARRVLEDLRAGRSLGWSGLTFGYPTDEELQRERLPPGLRITGAVRGAPEALVGRLLAGVDGRPIRNTLASYCEVAGGMRSGATVTLALASPGRSETERIRLRLP